MARGATLETIVALVRHEANLGSNTAMIADEIEKIKHVVRRTQETLYEDFDWPFLQTHANKDMAAGQRYYDFPAAINPERITRVDVLWNGTWVPIERGIDVHNYNSYDSDSDERSDPVLAWDWYTNGTSTQFEVWPIPSSAQCDVRFTGIRSLRALVADSDVADLDDYLIALHAAVSFTSEETKQEMIVRAEKRLARMKQNLKGGSRTRTLSGMPGREVREKGTIIRVSGA